ncbi:MAG: transcriptional repressor [Tetrasphaera sp.]|jgi:Fur family ferric uptake transcriptional regulator|nr:transcriptional repressor [Tetrasphaera sp.]
MSTRRTTRQQQAVSSILERHGDFRSAQEWHALLRESGEAVGLATVYRTLQTLADEGTIDVLRSPAGEAVYRACSSGGHHHHLVCRRCGRAEEIEAAEVERWTSATATAYGFTDVTHTLEVFGRCADCS